METIFVNEENESTAFMITLGLDIYCHLIHGKAKSDKAGALKYVTEIKYISDAFDYVIAHICEHFDAYSKSNGNGKENLEEADFEKAKKTMMYLHEQYLAQYLVRDIHQNRLFLNK
ncbi:hypothetical protein [Cedecea neteri]|uniref:Uncharacterized protein n=1 Tax=Cedecea neteri TaxID=158822 RepID=A0A291E0K4_9ENTR|nr:hypothetical protein [Cedecea neteri]ATF93368.1 hypothetical protein CO704_15260 [Cedecea neteri]